MNIIEKIEKEQLEKLSSGKQIPDFNPGDTIKVDVKVVEGTRERIQAFEGVCIARGGKGINESFTVRKISYGEGVERVFPLFSPKISSITLVRKGKVRRAKLYYLRELSGKKARIADKDRGDEADQYEYIEESPPVEETKTADTDTNAAEEPKAEEVEAKQAETKAEEAEAKPAEESKAEAAEESSKKEEKAAENKSDDNK